MFDEVKDKVTNGGVNEQGKLPSEQWNRFINELIMELNKRIISVVLNGKTHTQCPPNVYGNEDRLSGVRERQDSLLRP